tara:strand:- start:3977 stop:4870 length:894 start_codon:yes stop_codon:yes gene_type:complete
MIIPKEEWKACKLCGKDINEITKDRRRMGAYKSNYFKEHLEDEHDVTLNDYFDNKIKCPCGICGKTLDIVTKSSNIAYRKMACGRNKGLLDWAEKAKKTRKGSGNPMFGKKPWNLSLTKETSPSIMSVSQKMSNRTVSTETKKKQSEAAKKRKVHGHTGCKHSEENKKKFRANTLEMIKNGKFKHTDTLPSLRFESFLQDLGISYEKEKHRLYWSFDFYLKDLDIYIEVDGDYFHSNPKIYHNGPKTKTQKVNYYRDKRKNEYCINNNINLIRFWESDILGDEECVKQKLSALKKLD